MFDWVVSRNDVIEGLGVCLQLEFIVEVVFYSEDFGGFFFQDIFDCFR